MTATYNPQAAADQARATYREVTARLGLVGFDTAIPESVRTLAESTVDQTREAMTAPLCRRCRSDVAAQNSVSLSPV
jgi:hypothetical protein